MEINVAKKRNGQTGMYKVLFEPNVWGFNQTNSS